MSTGAATPGGEPGDGHVDPDLAVAVESAFDEVRDELGEDPQAAPASSGGSAAPGEPSSPEGGAPAGEAAGDDGGAPAGSPAGTEGEGEPVSELDRALAESARAAEDLARARADLYNLQQEYNGFVRRSRESAAGHRDAGQAAVVEALIPVLDEIELARQHGDLEGTFATTAGKLESILSDKFGLVRFGEVGEAFDPTLHEALMATESPDVDEPSVAMVLQPGYRLGERVVRAARVQVANPS